jgi:hypothetical protein
VQQVVCLPTLSQTSPLAQSYAVAHCVRQVLLSAQTRFPGQGEATGAPHTPVPSQLALVSVLPEQPDAPQLALAPGKRQAPSASQSVAPHWGSVVSHCAVQQLPLPVAPQKPLVHASLVRQGPVAFWATQAFVLQ